MLKMLLLDTGGGTNRKVANIFALELCTAMSPAMLFSVSLGLSLAIINILLIGLDEFICCFYSKQECRDINKLRNDWSTLNYTPTAKFTPSIKKL